MATFPSTSKVKNRDVLAWSSRLSTAQRISEATLIFSGFPFAASRILATHLAAMASCPIVRSLKPREIRGCFCLSQILLSQGWRLDPSFRGLSLGCTLSTRKHSRRSRGPLSICGSGLAAARRGWAGWRGPGIWPCRRLPCRSGEWNGVAFLREVGKFSVGKRTIFGRQAVWIFEGKI